MRVLELRGDRHLAEESLAGEGRGQVGPKDFDRDLAIVLVVVRQIDRRGRAATQLRTIR